MNPTYLFDALLHYSITFTGPGALVLTLVILYVYLYLLYHLARWGVMRARRLLSRKTRHGE